MINQYNARRGRISIILLKCTIIFNFILFVPQFLFGQASFENKDQRFIDTIPKNNGSQHFQKSQNFYDSVYRKFSRHGVTKMMYNLTFSARSQFTLPDTVQKITGELPFARYKGKIIRSIRVLPLAPFGTSLMDTLKRARTGIGKILNSVHINTRKFVLQKYLLFKPGEKVNPEIFADNERILRDLPAIDNARILISTPDSTNDSVDVLVMTKDVWSIGLELSSLSTKYGKFRIYDANLLGLGDRLSVSFSVAMYRAPFLRTDGISAIFSNIGGSFIDGYITLAQDDYRNKSAVAGIQRSFLVNKIRWAGGAWVSYNEDFKRPSDSVSFISYYTSENLWFGLSFLLKERKEPTRLILTGAVYNKDFSSRPLVTIDSNSQYYNNLQLFTGLAISRNNYYLTNYVVDFGKTENIPYGHIFQVTAGPDYNEFYTRVYTGFAIAGGNYLRKFGYLSIRLAMGGYIHKSTFEDGIYKAQLVYMTYLFKTPSQYRFRLYSVFDYRLGFNFRKNNYDNSNLNHAFQIDRVENEELLKGSQTIAFNLYTVMFTPWYVYGFKFAVLTQFQGGFVANAPKPLFKDNSFYSGIRLGLMIRNDNLVTPAYLFSIFFYPNTTANIPWFQYSFTNTLNLKIQDYNVSAPHVETLQN